MNKKDRESQLRNLKLKKPSLAFLVSMLLSALGWITINFSKEYTQTLSYTIHCYDLPEKTKMVSLSDSTIMVTIKTKGFNYLNPSFSDKQRVINLSVREITNQKSSRRAYTFDKNVLEEYIYKKELIGKGFIAIEHPERITFYLK